MVPRWQVEPVLARRSYRDSPGPHKLAGGRAGRQHRHLWRRFGLCRLGKQPRSFSGGGACVHHRRHHDPSALWLPFGVRHAVDFKFAEGAASTGNSRPGVRGGERPAPGRPRSRSRLWRGCYPRPDGLDEGEDDLLRRSLLLPGRTCDGLCPEPGGALPPAQPAEQGQRP